MAASKPRKRSAAAGRPPDGNVLADLIRVAGRDGTTVPAADLVPFLRHQGTRDAALRVAEDPALAPVLRTYLDVAGARGGAALALARMRDTASTGDLLARLDTLRSGDGESFVAALELMGDPAAIPALRQRLAAAQPHAVWALHHALVKLTGHEPVLPLEPDRHRWAAAARAAWAGWDDATPRRPRIEQLTLLDAARARLVVADGRGVVGIDYDPPVPGASWLRWDKSLLVAGARLYGVGSDCGTCETILHLAGWPERPATLLGQEIRESLADVTAVTREVLAALEPLLTVLRSGHYQVVLTDLDLEVVEEPGTSWWQRRLAARESGGESDWPGTTHFQLTEPIPGAPATYGVVLPSQPLAGAAPAAVTRHAARVTAGDRPAAAVLCWVEDRLVHGDHPERFLVGTVLDGHHKLLAYAQLGVPARALLIFRIEDSWGPADDRTRWIDEVTQPFATTGR